MEKDKRRTKDELVELITQLKETPAPKGFTSACEDLDIDLYEYEEYIAGLVYSYLSGLTIDAASVDRGDELDRKLDKCEERLHALRAYKALVSEMATLLIERLGSEP